MSQVARTLILFGLALTLAALLIHVVAALLAVALPLGLALILAGVVYHLVKGHSQG